MQQTNIFWTSLLLYSPTAYSNNQYDKALQASAWAGRHRNPMRNAETSSKVLCKRVRWGGGGGQVIKGSLVTLSVHTHDPTGI